MTRQEKTRIALEKEGYMSADDFPEKVLGNHPERNKDIVNDAVFFGLTLKETGEKHGLSRERVRQIALITAKRLLGFYA